MYTVNARREGETLCLLPSLIFDSVPKLETFLSTGGNKILADRLIRITGVLVQEDAAPQDVFAALLGAGRYMRHFLGVRKAGPNVSLVAAPQHGATDKFLSLMVHTRNNVGIAARSIVVANFGVEWDSSAVASEISEAPAKRFKGMLDQYFVESSDKGIEGPSGSEGSAEAAKKTEEAKKAKAQSQKTEEATEETNKAEAVEDTQNGVVLAVLGDCAAAGAMVVWRQEAGGSLSLRAAAGWTGNKKVSPKTTVWKLPDVKLESKGEFLEWQLDGAKSTVFTGKATTTLTEYIKDKAATSVARHTPDSFPPGTAPKTLKASDSVRVTTSNPATKKVLLACADNPHLGLMWTVGFKDQIKQVIPTGVMVYVKKQIIIPKDGEVRVS